MTEQKTDPDVELRPLRIEEAGDYAYLQRRVFPEYNTSRLGQWFCKCFFEQYAIHDDVIGIGAWRAGKLLGFITGCHRFAEERIHRILLFRAMLAAAVRPHLLFRSGCRRRFAGLLENLRRSRQEQAGTTPAAPREGEQEEWIKLPTMGVVPEARGQGIAFLLMNACSNEAIARGFRYAWGLCATTNHPMHSLFHKLGWSSRPTNPPSEALFFWMELSAT